MQRTILFLQRNLACKELMISRICWVFRTLSMVSQGVQVCLHISIDMIKKMASISQTDYELEVQI